MSKKPPARGAKLMKSRINLPLSGELTAALDEWRRTQLDAPGRPEAVRRLLLEALAAKLAGGKK